MEQLRTTTNREGRVLVVDDDPGIREVFADYLGRHGLNVETAADAASMQRVMARSPVDVVVLDVLMPPGEDGLTICRRIAESAGPPVILMSAMADAVDRIVGLELGADDYIAKPCNPRELLARVRSVMRAGQRSPEKSMVVEFAGWRLDFLARSLTAPTGVRVELSSGEYALLRAFVEHPQRVLTRDALIEYALGDTADTFDRAIDVQTCRLRKKLATNTGPELIRTVRNEGYMFTAKVLRAG